MITVLTQAFVNEVCKYGQGERCCGFLGLGAKGYRCLKESETLAPVIRGRLVCPRHGDVREVQKRYESTGQLTDERDLSKSTA